MKSFIKVLFIFFFTVIDLAIVDFLIGQWPEFSLLFLIFGIMFALIADILYRYFTQDQYVFLTVIPANYFGYKILLLLYPSLAFNQFPVSWLWPCVFGLVTFFTIFFLCRNAKIH